MDRGVRQGSRRRAKPKDGLGPLGCGESSGTGDPKVLVLEAVVQQFSFSRIMHGFEAGMQLEFVQDLMDVIFDRLRFDEEPLGNLFVG